MRNQNTQQTETSIELVKMKKKLPITSLIFLIITTVFIISWGIMSSSGSSSRPSTQFEIKTQKEFQGKWSAAQKEAEQKWDSTLKTKAHKYTEF